MQPKHFSYLLVFAMLLWGAGWPALKVLTYDLSLEVVSFWRFFLMIFAFIPILFYLGKPLSLHCRSFLVGNLDETAAKIGIDASA